MKILLVEPKVKQKAPNIALSKWARWAELNDHEWMYVRGCVRSDFIPNTILMSLLFTYESKKYEKTIDFYLKHYPNVIIKVGGVLPTLYPQWFNKVKWVGNPFFTVNANIEIHHGMCDEIDSLIPKYDIPIIYEDEPAIHQILDSITLYSSRGCVNKCSYCVVPKLEGDMQSLKTIKPIVKTALIEMPEAKNIVLYDNNFTEHEYFENIVNELIEFNMGVDIHGLHVESFNKKKAELLAKLKWVSQNDGYPYMRFSFDKDRYLEHIKKAYHLKVDSNIKAGFFLYMLYNYHDSPLDIWNRIEAIQSMVDDVGECIWIFPQMYEPLDGLIKRNYISKKWTKETVYGFRKLYTNNGMGYIPLTRSRGIRWWLGNTYEEFITNINMANSRKEKYHGRKTVFCRNDCYNNYMGK